MSSSSRMVGPFRVRPHLRNGAETGRWFVDIPASLTSDGQRKRKLFDTVDMAMKAAEKLLQRMDPETGLLAVEQTVVAAVSIEHTVAAWETHERQRVATLKKKAATLTNDLYKLRPVLRFFANKAIDAITEDDLVKYQAVRLQDGLRPVTVNAELNVLNIVFAWAVKHEHVTVAPKVERVPERKKAAVVIPTPDEVVRVIMALPLKYQLIVRFLAETGCRKGEARNLTWDCIDEVGGFAEIRSRDGWTPKTQQSEREIPLSEGLLAAMLDLPKEGQYVFPGASPDTPMGEFRKPWRKAVLDAKIMRRGRQVTFPVKMLRKAHATWQAERGLPESVLQDRMGHAKGSRITRQFYVQVTDEAKKAAVIMLPSPIEAQASSTRKKAGASC